MMAARRESVPLAIHITVRCNRPRHVEEEEYGRSASLTHAGSAGQYSSVVRVLLAMGVFWPTSELFLSVLTRPTISDFL